MNRQPFQDADPAHDDFQHLEDLATAYWYSEVLFAALDLELFDLIGDAGKDIHAISEAASCDAKAMKRLLEGLGVLELVHRIDQNWFNSQIANRYLMKSGASYLGDFLLYRRYMRPRWQNLGQKVSLSVPSSEKGPCNKTVAVDEDYKERNFQYVRATDALAKEKAGEICGMLDHHGWTSPVLDIGGGCGALCRRLIREKTGSRAHLLDLPEVLDAARTLYPDPSDWDRVNPIKGDFRAYQFEPGQRFGLVLLSNFLHAYSRREAQAHLAKALALLAPEGRILIHDYFPDRKGRSPQKGALYDLAMMLNTYNGACHESREITGWLRDRGMASIRVRDLSTDSSIILAGRKDPILNRRHPLEDWSTLARRAGFRAARLLPAAQVVVSDYVPVKCRFGCNRYNKNLSCPPNQMTVRETRSLLGAYQWALLVEGAPPGRRFHEQLLDLERTAFLSGLHKAFVLGAGPCPVCDACPADGQCRHRDKARPSMEGSGIDVYETAATAGFHLKPLALKGRYVKYMGLLLLE